MAYTVRAGLFLLRGINIQKSKNMKICFVFIAIGLGNFLPSFHSKDASKKIMINSQLTFSDIEFC